MGPLLSTAPWGTQFFKTSSHEGLSSTEWGRGPSGDARMSRFGLRGLRPLRVPAVLMHAHQDALIYPPRQPLGVGIIIIPDEHGRKLKLAESGTW